MTAHFEINDNFIAEQNQKAKAWLEEDYEHLAKQLQRRGVNIEDLTAKAQAYPGESLKVYLLGRSLQCQGGR